MEFILPIVGIEAVGDWSFTKFVQTKRQQPLYRIIGYVCYIAVLELFQKAIQFKGLSWANTAWDGWSNIVTGAVAVLIFGERPSLREWIGIILISLGIFFLGGEGIASYGNGK